MDDYTFRKILTAHRDRIFSYTWYCLRSREDAEDVTQEVFLRLWNQGPEFTPDQAESWLIRVAHNLCIDQSRRRRTVRTRLGKPAEQMTEAIPHPGGPWSDPEANLQQTGLRQEILSALATLPAQTRSIMLLHYFQGLPLREIARITGKNPSTIKVQVHRARKALRLVLEAGNNRSLNVRREIG